MGLLLSPDLYVVSPSESLALIHLAYFPAHHDLRGIAELAYDLFYIITRNWSVKTFQSTPGSYAIGKIDLRGLDAQQLPLATHQTRKVADFLTLASSTAQQSSIRSMVWF